MVSINDCHAAGKIFNDNCMTNSARLYFKYYFRNLLSCYLTVFYTNLCIIIAKISLNCNTSKKSNCLKCTKQGTIQHSSRPYRTHLVPLTTSAVYQHSCRDRLQTWCHSPMHDELLKKLWRHFPHHSEALMQLAQDYIPNSATFKSKHFSHNNYNAL